MGQLKESVLQNFLVALFGLSSSTISKLKADRQVKVWRKHGECCADCCTDRVTSIGGSSVIVWDGSPIVPYLHSLRLNSIPQDDNAHPHRAGGSQRLPSEFEQVWDQLGCDVCARVTNITMLADL